MGYPAQRVAALAGVTAQTVRAIEGGGNPPKLDTLARICYAINTKVILEFRPKGGKIQRILLSSKESE